MPNSRGIFGRPAETVQTAGAARVLAPAFEAICALRKWLVLGGILIGIGFAFVTSTLTDTGRGRPSDWPPAVLFALGALAAGLDFIRHGGRCLRGLLAAVLALFASVAVVALSPRHGLQLPFLIRPVSMRITLVLIAAFGAVAALAAAGRPHRPRAFASVSALAAILLLGAAGLACSSTGPASHAIPALLAVVVYDAWARAAC
jgi:hypothetical protein